ncbi:MAG: Ni/Fe hydrogenase subunit alpha [Kiritimatiellae bacterium]|nr:Ni/Fe hydrogenase subunit alpha [Kiritimatiellia bacterium]MDW8457888.1 Ni/Fe hydrogenase subunit alpha [Verrucomicrobiota bacterium]
MARTIVIDPVTRIEGHSKITVYLDDQNQVADAHFHVTQFRGFEKFTEGRPYTEMPAITARICGICPVSHLLAASKACDDLMAVKIPPTAAKLRRLLNYAQITQSHALSFFHLSSPDFLLGFDSDPAQRHIFGVASRYPEIAKDGIWLRKYGQQIIEWLGGKRIHAAWTVPGGVNAPLKPETRDKILEDLPKGIEIVRRTLDFWKNEQQKFKEEIEHFANFPSLFLGLVTPEGNLEHYDGFLRVVDADRKIIADKLEPTAYHRHIGEASLGDSYLKAPYFKPFGFPGGMYRVGPLARLNICDACGTPLADRELQDFRALRPGGAVLSSFYYHHARLIEILFALERIGELCNSADILNTHVRAVANPNKFEGVGVSEAPRGTLFHHYKINEQGLITWANLIVATGNNNLAMNKGITQAARHFVNGSDVREGALNRIEAVIRCYDPCLSCSTHALGQMPIRLTIVSAKGEILREIARG